MPSDLNVLSFNKPSDDSKGFLGLTSVPHQPPVLNKDTLQYSNGYKDDPVGEAALQELMREYPKASHRVQSLRVGAPLDYGIAGRVEESLAGTPIIELAPTDANVKALHYDGGPSPFQTQLSVARHELSHVMGVGDPGHYKPDHDIGLLNGVNDAYGVGMMSDQLHRDISLPSEGPIDPRLAGLKSAGRWSR